MNPKRVAALKAGGVLSGGAGVVGVWIWQREISYAASNPGSELAGVLQWLGLGLAALGAGGVCFAWALLPRDEENTK